MFAKNLYISSESYDIYPVYNAWTRCLSWFKISSSACLIAFLPYYHTAMFFQPCSLSPSSLVQRLPRGYCPPYLRAQLSSLVLNCPFIFLGPNFFFRFISHNNVGKRIPINIRLLLFLFHLIKTNTFYKMVTVPYTTEIAPLVACKQRSSSGDNTFYPFQRNRFQA